MPFFQEISVRMIIYPGYVNKHYQRTLCQMRTLISNAVSGAANSTKTYYKIKSNPLFQ